MAEEKKTIHLPAELAQIFRAPHSAVAQDVRSLPPRTALPTATPRVTTILVMFGWLALAYSGYSVARTALQYSHSLRDEAKLNEQVKRLGAQVERAKEKSNTDVAAQQFMVSHESLLSEVRSQAAFTATLLAAKPKGLALTQLDVRAPATGTDLSQWDVTMRFRTDDKTSGSLLRESMIDSLTTAGFAVKIQNRAAAAEDPDAVVLYALIRPPSAAPAKAAALASNPPRP